MLFNSFQFAAFFAIIFSLYIISRHKWQNRMLLVASYIFYGAWDWRFLLLLFASTLLDYYCAIRIYESANPGRRKIFLLFSIFGNLAILGFFKYYNFFIQNAEHLLGYFGVYFHSPLLHIILPVGISFYTFQTMGYTIDVYRGQIQPARNFLDFALFVSFFPQLVAGPVERAKNLLAQIIKPRVVSFAKFYEGYCLILWGLFLKMFVGDNLSKIVDSVFAGPPYDSLRVVLAAYAFSFQIYADFAGYSEIARGLGKCMGFEIMLNFRLPFLATNPMDFWQRWNISVSSWFKDYLYIPLGGNRKGALVTYRNIAITMVLAGLWHGAKWTFVIFGVYWAALWAIHHIFKPIGKMYFALKVIVFFQLASLGFLIFRAESVQQVAAMLSSFYPVTFDFNFQTQEIIANIVFYTGILLLVNLFQFYKRDMDIVYKYKPAFSAILHAVLFYFVVFYSYPGQKFIYFDF